MFLPKFISPKNPLAPAKAPAETATAPPGKRRRAGIGGDAEDAADFRRAEIPGGLDNQTEPGFALDRRGAAEQKSLPAVQTELSLDTVKVVHNDLSDADVEVVPIKSRPAAAEIPALSPAKKSWEILGERLLRATALY